MYFYIVKPASLGRKLGIKEEQKIIRHNLEISCLGKLKYFIRLSRNIGNKGAYAAPSHLGFISLIISLAAFVVSLLILRNVFLALVASGVSFFAGSHLYAEYLVQRQRNKISKQINEVIFSLTSTLRAGKTLVEAINACSEDLPAPLGPELTKVYTAVKHGGEDLDTALKKMLERLGNHHIIQKVVLSIIVSRQTGGNVSTALEEIGMMVDDELYTKEFAKSHSSHGRMVAVTFNLVMILVAINMNRMFHSAFTDYFLSNIKGQLLLFGCLGAIVLGWIIIHRVLANVHNV